MIFVILVVGGVVFGYLTHLGVHLFWAVVVAGAIVLIGNAVLNGLRGRRTQQKIIRKAKPTVPRARPAATEQRGARSHRASAGASSRPSTVGWKCSPAELFSSEYVSWTRLKKYADCPKRFELVYLMGKPDPVGKAAELGPLVHKMLELYTSGAGASLNVGPNSVEEIMGHYTAAVADTNPRHSLLRSEALPYVRTFVDLNGGSHDVSASEHHCEGGVGYRKLKCIIDRVDTDPTGMSVIVDYKTGNPRYADSRQLNVYGYALHPDGADRVKLQYQFLKTGETRDWSFTPALREGTQTWLHSQVVKIESTRTFMPQRGPLCRCCGLSRYCG